MPDELEGAYADAVEEPDPVESDPEWIAARREALVRARADAASGQVYRTSEPELRALLAAADALADTVVDEGVRAKKGAFSWESVRGALEYQRYIWTLRSSLLAAATRHGLLRPASDAPASPAE
jgi:hypothetical protein